MHLRDLVSVSYGNLARTRGRALLTMLGIIIGIASVILMVAIGQAAQNFLLSQVASLGADVVMIANGSGDTKGGPPSPLQKQTLTERDLVQLRRQPWVAAASAYVISTDVATYADQSLYAQIWGATQDELKIFPATVAEGRFLLQDDVDSRSRVAVIGYNVSNKLFPNQDPLGKLVRVNHQNFRVVGVMAHGGTRFFTKLDDIIYIPVSTALDLYNRNRLNFISMKPEGISPQEAIVEARYLLRDLHKIDNPNGDLSKDDFIVRSQEDAAKNAGIIGQILQILLGSVAGISLVVAGIGIMNIMYVTVTERTAEIGLRKAVGARENDVLNQFLAEAVLLTTVGGILGILLGLLLSVSGISIIAHFQDGWSFSFPTDGIILAFTVSAAIGIAFGYFPARKAARLNPIEALRYE
ncbi:MAG TPA: ABC transporter permease [Verrucomicrobiae bacterium]|nr:ABC transporter permease [Verrucomicrobiae bacterium]